MRSKPQFAQTLKEAKEKKRILQNAGYVVNIFKKGTVGLIQVA